MDKRGSMGNAAELVGNLVNTGRCVATTMGRPWAVPGREFEGVSVLILPMDIFFKNPHRLDFYFSSLPETISAGGWMSREGLGGEPAENTPGEGSGLGMNGGLANASCSSLGRLSQRV